jgi:hypothetical protein
LSAPRGQRGTPLLLDLPANRETLAEGDVQQQSSEPQEVERLSESELQEDSDQPARTNESWMRENVPQQNELTPLATRGRLRVVTPQP